MENTSMNISEDITTTPSEETTSESTTESIEPIYKSKDGQIVTHSQLLGSGYTVNNINSAKSSNVLSVIGDTKDADQGFKSQDGQLVTTKDLLESGYKQQDIDSAIVDGILSPMEKKNSGEPLLDKNVPTDGQTLNTTSPSKSQLPSDFNIVEQAKLAKTLSHSLKDSEYYSQSEEIKKQLKDAGYDADKIVDMYKDIPPQFYNKEGYRPQDEQKNPLLFQRTIASTSWIHPLKAVLKSKLESKDISKEDYQTIAKTINDIQNPSAATMYSSVSYGGERINYGFLSNLIRKNIDDEDLQKRMLKNLSTERAVVYGQTDSPAKDTDVDSAPERKYLDHDQTVAYQYLQDSDPQAAKGYEAVFINPSMLTGNAKAGWEDKMAKLKNIGLQLQQNYVGEKVKAIKNEMDSPDTDPNKIPALQNKLDELLGKSQNLDEEYSSIKTKYPTVSFNDAYSITKDLLGDKLTDDYGTLGGAIAWGLGKTAQEIGNTWEGVKDLATAPFLDNEDSKINQLAAAGDLKEEDAIYGLPESKKALQTSTVVLKPELKSKIDAIVKNDKLSYDEKHNQVMNLVMNNQDMVSRVPIQGGKFNISPTTALYSVLGLGSSLVPYIALEAVTGGGATAGIARKLLSSFNAAALTSYHRELGDATARGEANPTRTALLNTAIQAAKMAGAGTPQMIKGLYGTKTAVGEMVNKMSDDAIEAAMKKSNSTFELFGKTIKTKPLTDAAIATVKAAGEGVKGGAKFESVMRAGDIVSGIASGDADKVKQQFNEAIVGVLSFGAFGTIMGTRGQYKKINQLEAGSLLKASENPEGMIETATDMFKNNKITKDKYDEIVKNIKTAATVSSDLKYIDDNGNPLNEKKKGQLLLLKVQESNLLQQLAGNVPEKFKENVNKQIENINEDVNEVTLPEQKPEFTIGGKAVSEEDWLNAVKNNLNVEIDYNGDNEKYHQMLRDIGGVTTEEMIYEYKGRKYKVTDTGVSDLETGDLKPIEFKDEVVKNGKLAEEAKVETSQVGTTQAELPEQKTVELSPLLEKTKTPAPSVEAGKVNPLDSDKGTDNKDFKDYNGMFSKEKTTFSGLDDILKDDENGDRGYHFFYKRKKASINMMSPDEYLKIVKEGQKTTEEEQQKMITEEQKDKIKKGIKAGNKIKMPHLSYIDGKYNDQEGRNRATVAKEMGEKLIPVVIEENVTNKDLKNKSQEIINEANKDLKSDDIDEIIDYASNKFNLHRDVIAYLKDNASELIAELPKQKENVGEEATKIEEEGDDLILSHGTKHDFDKFQLEKIGTGEGAQAFGYGLYFTDGSKIAEGYAKKLSEDGTGLVYSVRIKNGKKANWAEWRQPLDESIESDFYNKLTDSEKKEYQDYVDNTFDAAKEKDYTGAFGGLELSKEGLLEYPNGKPSASGNIYQDLKDAFGQEKATEIFKRAGIDGIKYQSKGGFGKENNYVVFNPESIEVIEKNKPKLPKQKAEAVVTPTKVEAAELPKQNKDNQSEFITDTKRQKVNRVGDEIVVTDAKTGNDVSRKTYNKAIEEYADNFDFTHGEEGESTTQNLDPNKTLSQVIETSNNPHQIAVIYAENNAPFVVKDMTIDDMISEYGIPKISIESFRSFGDINRLSRKMRSNYIANKNEARNLSKADMSLDSYAKELSDHYFPDGDGTQISPEDIVNFMETYESKKEQRDKKNPLLSEAEDKFKKLTGLNLTRQIADKAIGQKIAKESQAQQNILKQDYENRQQLEDEYWRQYEETNGFTEEANPARVNKQEQKNGEGKVGEKVTPKIEVQAELPILKNGENVSFVNFSGGKLNGEKIEVPGYENLDLILVKDGFDNKVYELSTGMELAEVSAFSKEEAIREAANKMLEKGVTSEKIHSKILKSESDRTRNSLKVNQSPAYESYKKQKQAEYDEKPFVLNEQDRNEINKMAEDVQSIDKNLSETLRYNANKRKVEGDKSWNFKLSDAKRMVEFAKQKAEVNKLKIENKPLPDEYKEKARGTSEESFKKAINEGYVKDRFENIPDDFKQPILDAWRKQNEIFNKYGYSPNELKKSEGILLTVGKYLYSLNSRDLAKKEARVSNDLSNIRSEIKKINEIYSKEFGLESGEIKLPEEAKAELKAELPEQTAIEKAREARKAAKEKLDAIRKGLGIIKDTKKEAEALFEYHKALVAEAKEYIKAGIKSVEEWAKEVGEKVSYTLQTAWDEATGKIEPIEKAEELVAELPKQEDEGYAGVRKEKLKEISGVKEMFEKRTKIPWSKTYQSALENLQKMYPNKSIYEAMKTRVNNFALRLDNNELFNPTSEDIAVFTLFRAETQKRINQVEGLDSADYVERQAALSEIDALNDDLFNIARVTNPGGEAGRAFAMLQSEAKMDENYGLKIRRAELMKTNGGEKLSDADMEWTQKQWEKEKEIMKQEQELKEKSMQEDFDKKVSELEKEYEAKLKLKGQKGTVKSKTLSQSGKDIADKIRKLAIQKGQTAVDVTFGLRNLAVEAVAQLVEKGATIADAIVTVLKDAKFKDITPKDLEDHISDSLTKKDKEEELNRIKEFAEKEGITDITDDMVRGNLIRDYVNSHVGEVDKKDLFDTALKDLKEILPNATKEKLLEAYIKKGEFKQPTKEQLQGGIKQQQNELKKIAKEELTADQQQKIKLDAQKELVKRRIKELQKKIDNNEFEEALPVQLKKSDAELIKLQKQKSIIEGEYRKKKQEAEEKNKGAWKKGIEFLRSVYVNTLISLALPKVGTMAVVRPASEAITKQTLGRVFEAFFPNWAKAAKSGGESTSIASMKQGFNAMIRQYSPEQLEGMYDKAEKEYVQAKNEYLDYKDSASPNEKKLQELKNKMNEKLVKTQGTFLYKFIGGSSIKDALQSLIERSNEIEKQFGNIQTETLKDSKGIEKINYVLNFIGRSHSALKTFSGRASFASGFMARLEGAVEAGEDVSDASKIIEIANESYLDWERGKYQQDNAITNMWNKVVDTIERSGKFGSSISSALRFDVPVTKVPINLLQEALGEYTFGTISALAKAMKVSKEIKSQLKEEGFTNGEQVVDGLTQGTTKEEFKKELNKRISEMDGEQAATIMRCFRKGGIGAGLAAYALISGAIQFGIFPHMGQKKKKEEEDLKEGELNPGDIMVGDKKLSESMSKIIEHVPAFYPVGMSLGLVRAYQDEIKKGKTTKEAAAKSLYTHLKIIENGFPQSKVISPISIGEGVVRGFEKKAEQFGLTATSKEESTLEKPEYAIYKEKGVRIPKTGKVSQIRVDTESGYMAAEQYDKYVSLVDKYMEEGFKDVDEDRNVVVVKGLKDLPNVKYVETVGEKEKTILGKDLPKDDLQNKVNALHDKATKKAKEELGLVKKKPTRTVTEYEQ